MDITGKKTFIVNLVFYVILVGLVIIATKFLLGYTLPFIIGIILALVVQKPALKLSQQIKLKKETIAMFLVAVIYILFWFTVVLIGWGIITKINGAIPKISDYVDKIAETLTHFYKDILKVFFKTDSNGMWKNFFTSSFSQIGEKVGTALSDFAANLAKGLPSFLFSSVVTLVASCYIAKDFNRLKKFFFNLISKNTAQKLIKIKSIIKENVFKLLKGFLILTFISFIELVIGFMILGIKHPIVLGVVISLIDFLPVLGVGTVLIPWTIFLFIIEETGSAIGILILYLIITLVRNFAEPRIIGGQMGINPLFTLAAMFIGLKTAGIVGLFLFPITLIVVFDYYREELEK